MGDARNFASHFIDNMPGQIADDTKVMDGELLQRKCLDYTGGGEMIVEESACQFIACCCITGAGKRWCGIKDFAPLYIKRQDLCCDQRCACPPSPATVPAGISICGFHLWGECGGSLRGKGPGAGAATAATSEPIAE